VNQWAILALAGLVALGIGLGLFAGVRLKDHIEVELRPRKGRGAIFAAVGFVILVVGVLGAAGVISDDTTNNASGTASVTPIPATTLPTPKPTSTGDSSGSTPPSSPSPSNATICRTAANMILKEVGAVNEVISQVISPADGLPTAIRPGYAKAQTVEKKINSATDTAWQAYAAVLSPPTDENVPIVLHDLRNFIDRLPDEIRLGPMDQLDSDWGALNDRPQVLRDKVVPPVLKQCGSV
jgi:hypothetical protein